MINLRDFNFVDLLDSGSSQIEPDIQFNIMDKNGTLLGKSDNIAFCKLINSFLILSFSALAL